MWGGGGGGGGGNPDPYLSSVMRCTCISACIILTRTFRGIHIDVFVYTFTVVK